MSAVQTWDCSTALVSPFHSRASCPGLWAGSVCPTGLHPRRALQGWSRNAPVFLSRHLPRTNVPEAESQNAVGERQSHGPGHDCGQPGEALPWAIAWPLSCRSGLDAHLPNPRTFHGAVPTCQACRVTRSRIRRRWAGAAAPRACTMPLLLLLPRLALLEQCLRHRFSHHGVTRRVCDLTARPHPHGHTLGHLPPKHRPRHAPPPHVTSGGGAPRACPILPPWQGRVPRRPLTPWPWLGIAAGSLQRWGGGAAGSCPLQCRTRVSWCRWGPRGNAEARRCQRGERWSCAVGLLLGAALVWERCCGTLPQGPTRGL